MKVLVYGASDDLVEVEGDLSHEFDCYDRVGNRLTFDDGTVLKIEYGNQGLWKIEPVAHGPGAEVIIEHATDPDSDNYSDRATVTGNFTKVKFRKGREAGS